MPHRDGVRRIKTVTQLDPDLRAQVEALAADEHEGNLARMLRELVREGLAARERRAQGASGRT